jgi:hypothetical protein
VIQTEFLKLRSVRLHVSLAPTTTRGVLLGKVDLLAVDDAVAPSILRAAQMYSHEPGGGSGQRRSQGTKAPTSAKVMGVGSITIC